MLAKSMLAGWGFGFFWLLVFVLVVYDVGLLFGGFLGCWFVLLSVVWCGWSLNLLLFTFALDLPVVRSLAPLPW